MLKKSLLLLCIGIFAMSPKTLWGQVDDGAYILGLRYPKNYDIKTYEKKDDIQFITYTVCLPFPSKELLTFYDVKIKDIGWFPFVDPSSRYDRTWGKYIDSTTEGCPVIHQLHATWVNKEHSRMADIVIRYISTNMTREEKLHSKEPNNDVQEVIVQVGPFLILPSPMN